MPGYAYILLFLAVFTNGVQAMDCSTAFAQRFGRWTRVDEKLSPDNLDYLAINRAALRQLWKQANEKHFESEHAIRRILLGQMLGSHAILFGDGGAGKSDLLRAMTHIPRLQPDGTRKMDVFAVTVHEQMSDASIKGWVSERSQRQQKRTRNRKEAEVEISAQKRRMLAKIREGEQSGIIHNAHTLIQYSEGMLDEVDKGNPITLAALLDVLNEKVAQYGFETQQVRTHFVGMTGNKTLHEFIEAFIQQGYHGTGEALLDRILFKIYMHDYLTEPDNRLDLSRAATESRRKQGRKDLENPFSRYQNTSASHDNYVSPFPDVDLRWLGQIASAFVKLHPTVYEMIQDISRQSRLTYASATKKNEAAREEARREGRFKAGYQAPSSISNRTLGIYPKLTAHSALLDLMLLPDDAEFGITTAKLGGWMNRGLELDGISAWRLKDAIPTAATGDAKLSIDPATGMFKVRYHQDRMTSLIDRSTSTRSHEALKHYHREREEFTAITEDMLDKYVTRIKELSAIFAKELPNEPMRALNQRGIENFLLEKQDLAEELEP